MNNYKIQWHSGFAAAAVYIFCSTWDTDGKTLSWDLLC